MATLRNKRKLAALNKENSKEHPRSNLAQNSNVARSQEDYITQVSEEIQGRVTKKLSQEFSRTENPILGALARLDDFLMNPLLQGHSGTAPETSRNALSISRGTNENDSQSDPHPEAVIFHNQMTENSGPEDGHDNTFAVYSYCSNYDHHSLLRFNLDSILKILLLLLNGLLLNELTLIQELSYFMKRFNNRGCIRKPNLVSTICLKNMRVFWIFRETSRTD